MRYRFPDYQVAGGDADTTIFLFHGAVSVASTPS
jgi:hypothetical protein